MGCFATKSFAEGKVLGFYYNNWIYAMMLDTLNDREVYAEELMAATCDWLNALAIRLSK